MNTDVVINYSKREPYFFMKTSHQHDFYEIYYLLSGQRRFFVEDEIYYVNKGDLVLIKKGVLHKTSYASDKSHENFGLYLSSDYMEKLFTRYGKENMLECFLKPHLTLTANQQEYIENLLWRMRNEYTSHEAYGDELIKCYVNELLIFLLRYKKELLPSEEYKLRASDMVCGRAAKYITNNYMKPLTLKHVATYVNMSPTYFSKKFMKDTGFGFNEYLTHIRIKHACELLIQTKKTITEIAFLCGYNDSNYFGDVFRKTKGISPSDFRKEHKISTFLPL